MTRHRKDRGFRTERVVAAYLSQWWRNASIGRGAGKDIHNVPFDIEVKARSDFSPLTFIKQVEKRAQGKELSAVVCRMNGQGEDASQYLAFMRFQDLVDLMKSAKVSMIPAIILPRALKARPRVSPITGAR